MDHTTASTTRFSASHSLFCFFICLFTLFVFFSFTFPFVWEVVLRAKGDVGRQEDMWDHDHDVKSARINKVFFNVILVKLRVRFSFLAQ